MESSNFKIGKIRSYNSFIGEIVTKDGTYIFTSENISPEEVISLDDMVIFRGEEIHNTKKAYFIKKIDPNLNIEEQIYKKVKTYNSNKENE